MDRVRLLNEQPKSLFGKGSETFSVEEHDLKRRIREHTMNVLINLEDLKSKAKKAQMMANITWNSSLDNFGRLSLSGKADAALEGLSVEVRKSVQAHGVASNLREAPKDGHKIETLVSILVTGELKGETAPLSGYVPVFTDAPFVLLSNKGEMLTVTDVSGRQKISGLRTVLVNGEYEGVIPDLKKAFPFVDFRSSDKINDRVFDMVNLPYKSYDDRENEEILSRRTK